MQPNTQVWFKKYKGNEKKSRIANTSNLEVVTNKIWWFMLGNHSSYGPLMMKLPMLTTDYSSENIIFKLFVYHALIMADFHGGDHFFARGQETLLIKSRELQNF